MDDDYTKDEMEDAADSIVEALFEDIENDPMKMHLLAEVVEGLNRGDDIREDLLKMFSRRITEALIDYTVKLDNSRDEEE